MVASLVVLLIVVLIRASGEAELPVAELGEPNRIGTTTGSPADLPGLPDATGSAAVPTPAVETPRAEPPLPAPVTPSKRPVTAPAPAGPPTITSYEAESSVNTLAGTKTFVCHGCSGDRKVGRIGAGMGTLQFNGVGATDGPATLTLVYVNGENTRVAQLSVNGEPARSLSFPGTGGWSTVGTHSVVVRLRAGANTFRLSNSTAAAPDFDRIVVSVPDR